FLLFGMTKRTMAIQPAVTGKLSTSLQLCSVAFVLVSLTRPALARPGLESALFYVTGIVTASAGIQYMYRGLAWLQRHDEQNAAAGERGQGTHRRLPDRPAR